MKKFIFIPLAALLISQNARGDMFGGDLVILGQILQQSIQTVLQLKAMLETGRDTLDLLRDVNSGVKSGLDIIRVINPNFDPGVYGGLNKANDVLRAIQDIYGAVPKGTDHDLIQTQDQSVAEVISMNRNLYDYADQVDRERDRILFHAEVVSPQGAGKLQNQALGVLIGVTTQLLRTQSQMLKLLGQNMALQNRKEKVSSENFQNNYDSLSTGFKSLPKESNLPRIGR